MPWPQVTYSEEVMREGFGIESTDIPLSAKLELLEALSQTGLRRICVGAFVSPRYVPQMADFEDLLRRMKMHEGVTYLPFIHNAKAREKARLFSPPLTVEDEVCSLFIDICDVHQRRNVNRSVRQIMDLWPQMIEEARARGVTEGRAGIGSAWGSNFLGRLPRDYRFAVLDRQITLLREAGMEVTEIGLHDSQSFLLPHEVEEDLRDIRRRWPDIRQFHLHFHNARGMALPGLYAALRTLDDDCHVLIDGTLGGIGGGQFGGNGTVSGMPATEDVIHMLEGMGIETGVDIDRLVDCVWMLEEIIGRPAYGHVSRAGPRPADASRHYDPNMPAVMTPQGARHFRLGPSAYASEGYAPWREPITGPFHTGDGLP